MSLSETMNNKAHSNDHTFAVAIALTHDHALMACGFLAKLRYFHPQCDLFIITDQSSLQTASNIAEAFDAKKTVVTDNMGFDCLEWGPIVTSKFRVFDLPTNKPVVFLDIDQILAKPIDGFVKKFLESNVILAGGADDEPLCNQFQDGKTPEGLDPNITKVINTGAFITIPNQEMYEEIRLSIPRFSGLTRLPTQGLINGLLHEKGIPFDVYGDEFMIGPFNKNVIDPESAALVHLWTPRPPFMWPNPKRTGVDGDLTWEECVSNFEANGVRYPFERLRDEYMQQMFLFEKNYSELASTIEKPDLHNIHYHDFLDSKTNLLSVTQKFDV